MGVNPGERREAGTKRHTPPVMTPRQRRGESKLEKIRAMASWQTRILAYGKYIKGAYHVFDDS
jgi:hypothetical protein